MEWAAASLPIVRLSLMGLEVRCRGEFGNQAGDGKLQLEGTTLLFRGAFRLKMDLKLASKVDSTGGVLRVRLPEGEAHFHIGANASRWKDKILNPPSVLDKLGVKPESMVSLAGVRDPDFLADLRARCATTNNRPKPESDLVLFSVEERQGLNGLAGLVPFLKKNGGVWIVYPKANKAVTENDVLAAIKLTGLVGTKVCAFSSTHTALKAVIPVARR